MLLGISIVMMLLFTGCNNSGVENRNVEDQAYINEGNGEEDAVNTLQVGTKYKVVGIMDELRDGVVNMLDGNYWPDALLSEEELAERTGISSNMYDNYLAEYQHTEAGNDMLILVEAKEEEVETVERYLNEYREVLLNIYANQPQNRAKVYASRIEIIDNYACYVQLGGDISGLEPEGEDAMISYCQQENERAIYALEKKILGT